MIVPMVLMKIRSIVIRVNVTPTLNSNVTMENVFPSCGIVVCCGFFI